MPTTPYDPAVFNLDSPQYAALPPGNQNPFLGMGLRSSAGPGIYSFSGNQIPAPIARTAYGSSGKSSGTTNYFLNGVPIPANQLDAALKALQNPTPGAPVAPMGPQFDPAAPFNARTPGVLPGLDTSGVNPYLQDPLMSSYYGMINPVYGQQQQPFYGDPELFNAPTVAGAIR